MTEIRLLQLRAGAVRQLDGWRSAIFKEAVEHPLWLGATGLAGDAVGDTKHHGGPEQAVLAYAESHYADWKREGFTDERGAFGENLLLTGLSDQTACIGDSFELGDARLQISCPRVPCATLVRRHGRPDILERVFATARGGWYFRVLREGFVAPGQEMRLLERPHPEWSVARALHARWRAGTDKAEARALSAVTALNPKWRAMLA
ncbi:MAG TPA: MOSC domain-containing protein [Holophagaceae bacterium]|nr:MOSC domain-containing protein [Holophagaceae bacterium]